MTSALNIPLVGHFRQENYTQFEWRIFLSICGIFKCQQVESGIACQMVNLTIISMMGTILIHLLE